MKKKRFNEEQIHSILKESEAGLGTPEICRKYGISKNTFYNWRTKYSGMELSDLKKLVAELSLDNQALKSVLSKKW